MNVYCNGTGRRGCPCRYCAPCKPEWRDRIASAVALAAAYALAPAWALVYHGGQWVYYAGRKRGWWR